MTCLTFPKVSSSNGTNCTGRGVAAEEDDRADDGTSSAKIKIKICISEKPKKKEIITLNRNHEISKSNANRFRLQKKSIITLVHLWVSPLDSIQSSLGTEGLTNSGQLSSRKRQITKHTLRSAPP